LAKRRATVLSYRRRQIDTLSEEEGEAVRAVFARFEPLLGRVGTAKCLHLIAPTFFPLWDTNIAAKFGTRLKPGSNANQFWRFMRLIQGDIRALGGSTAIKKVLGNSALKLLDEYAYAKFTMRWV